MKVFPSFLQLHGKTYDYKIPYTSVLRLFLLPHKDQRFMFFVVSMTGYVIDEWYLCMGIYSGKSEPLGPHTDLVQNSCLYAFFTMQIILGE